MFKYSMRIPGSVDLIIENLFHKFTYLRICLQLGG